MRRMCLKVEASVCVLSAIAMAANYSWTGYGANDHWNTTSNWAVSGSPSFPDDTSDDVTIAIAANVDLMDESVGDMTLSADVTFGDNPSVDPLMTVESLTINGSSGGSIIKIKQMAHLDTD